MDFIGLSSSLLFLDRPEFMGQDFVALFIDPEFFNHQFHRHADVQFIEIASRKQRLYPDVRQIDPAVGVGNLAQEILRRLLHDDAETVDFPSAVKFHVFQAPVSAANADPLFSLGKNTSPQAVHSLPINCGFSSGEAGVVHNPSRTGYGFLNIGHC